jgi:hypothetical protein
MKHLLLSLVLIFGFFLTGKGQTPDFIKVYYPAINNAELAITTQQYSDALIYYKRAFKSVESGFARDYRNAILCAIQSKDDAFAFQYLEKLVLKGMDKYYLEDKVFESLRSKKAWAKLMNSYDRLHKESLKRINGEYLRELSAMGDRDQFFRAKEGSYKLYGDTIAKIDLENVLRFQQLVGDYGFPSEDLIGAFISEQNAPYNIVLHHHAQNLSNKKYKYLTAPSLDQIIVQAAQTGKCSPGHAGFLLSLQNDPSLNYCAWGINQVSVNGAIRPYYLLDKIPDNQWDKINALRAEIGLESLDDFRIKCQFRLDNPNTPFTLSGHQNLNIWDMDEEMAKDFETDFVKLLPTFSK